MRQIYSSNLSNQRIFWEKSLMFYSPFVWDFSHSFPALNASVHAPDCLSQWVEKVCTDWNWILQSICKWKVSSNIINEASGNLCQNDLACEAFSSPANGCHPPSIGGTRTHEALLNIYEINVRKLIKQKTDLPINMSC